MPLVESTDGAIDCAFWEFGDAGLHRSQIDVAEAARAWGVSEDSAGIVAERLFALVADWGLRDGSIRCLWNFMDESGNQTVG